MTNTLLSHLASYQHQPLAQATKIKVEMIYYGYINYIRQRQIINLLILVIVNSLLILLKDQFGDFFPMLTMVNMVLIGVLLIIDQLTHQDPLIDQLIKAKIKLFDIKQLENEELKKAIMTLLWSEIMKKRLGNQTVGHNYERFY
jgi:intracellular septation protein A